MTTHLTFMKQAIDLSESARIHAPPNPWVGCVIVKNGKIVGQGFTKPPGQGHAEVCALLDAGEEAREATAYVTLEPCSHFGRTGPCVDVLIEAGIREVFIGIQDPDSSVQGNGIRRLEHNGIKVFQGICADEIQDKLEPYLYHRKTGLPYTILKSAMSLDGRTAAMDMTSQWITSNEAREDVHLFRAHSQAIIIGSGTALKDQPQLTARHPLFSHRQPLRVLLDGRGQVPAKGPLFDTTLAPTLVITSLHASTTRQREWEASGAEVINVSSIANGVDLEEVWKLLGKRGILQAFVEGGSTLQTSLLDSKLVNKLIVYLGPLLLGSRGIPFYSKEIKTLSEAKRLSLNKVLKFGDTVRMDYKII